MILAICHEKITHYTIDWAVHTNLRPISQIYIPKGSSLRRVFSKNLCCFSTSNNGASIVGALIGVAILGIGAVITAKFFSSSNQQARHLQQFVGWSNFEAQVQTLLTHPISCRNTFASTNLTGSTQNVSIRNAANTVIFANNTKFDAMQLTRLEVTPVGSITGAGVHQLRVFIEGSKVASTGMSNIGNAKYSSTVYVNAVSTNGTSVASCGVSPCPANQQIYTQRCYWFGPSAGVTGTANCKTNECLTVYGPDPDVCGNICDATGPCQWKAIGGSLLICLAQPLPACNMGAFTATVTSYGYQFATRLWQLRENNYCTFTP